jgi:hypothetical protein
LFRATLSTGISHFRWFSLSYAVNFAVSIFLLSAQLRFVRASNGKLVVGSDAHKKWTSDLAGVCDRHDVAVSVPVSAVGFGSTMVLRLVLSNGKLFEDNAKGRIVHLLLRFRHFRNFSEPRQI